MTWKILALCAAAVLTSAAAKAPPRKAPAAKPAAAQAAFDARDPASMVALLTAMGAKAEVAQSAQDEVNLKVTTPGYGFGVQFAGCSAATKKECKAVAFTTQSGASAPTLAQINGFNQTSITCKAWQDKAGLPHVMYSALVSAADSRAEMQQHVGAWQGCLANFGDFLGDPPGYLASAP